MTSILSLPQELLPLVASHLDLPDLDNFAQASLRFTHASKPRRVKLSELERSISYLVGELESESQLQTGCLKDLMCTILKDWEAAMFLDYLYVYLDAEQIDPMGGDCSVEEQALITDYVEHSELVPREACNLPEELFRSLSDSDPEFEHAHRRIWLALALLLPVMSNLKHLTLFRRGPAHPTDVVTQTLRDIHRAASKTPQSYPLQTLEIFQAHYIESEVVAYFLALPSLKRAQISDVQGRVWPDDCPKSKIHLLHLTGNTPPSKDDAYFFAEHLAGPCTIYDKWYRGVVAEPGMLAANNIIIPYEGATRAEWTMEEYFV